MNLLITGGCGYVGTKLTQAVLERTPHNVTVLDTQWFGNHLPEDPRLTVARGSRACLTRARGSCRTVASSEVESTPVRRLGSGLGIAFAMRPA